jgi:hypothetical protein
MKRLKNYFESALRVLAAPGCFVILVLTMLALVIPTTICKIFGAEEPPELI